MDHQKTIARPYAKAVFEFALEQKKLDNWSTTLKLLAMIAENPAMQSLYSDPNISPEELSSIFLGISGKDENTKNFILILNHYDRLSLLPQISELFEEAKAEYEKVSTVFVTSAFPLEDSIQKKLKASLEIRLQHEVIMDYELDKNLLGGAIIRAGDWVVDGSVRAKLEKLKQAVIS
ncbi:MAG TPA: F0F1 ATP synthase subunit delta [Gammaproteobacteria bacterium]|nr:F0F1 ATP synthase subunit delta [Gammaproteobacteria bacterium]